jgi:hypothetical protein
MAGSQVELGMHGAVLVGGFAEGGVHERDVGPPAGDMNNGRAGGRMRTKSSLKRPFLVF